MSDSSILLHINSVLDRRVDDVSTSDWTTFLYKPIKVPRNRVAKLSVEHIELPNTSRSFSSYDRTFYYIVNPTAQVVDPITISGVANTPYTSYYALINCTSTTGFYVGMPFTITGTG